MKHDDEEPIRATMRLSPALHAKLTAAARAENRSFNAEIVKRLEESFAGSALDQVLAILRRIERKIAK
jgi:hypothetical protein